MQALSQVRRTDGRRWVVDDEWSSRDDGTFALPFGDESSDLRWMLRWADISSVQAFPTLDLIDTDSEALHSEQEIRADASDGEPSIDRPEELVWVILEYLGHIPAAI